LLKGMGSGARNLKSVKRKDGREQKIVARTRVKKRNICKEHRGEKTASIEIGRKG